MFLTIQYPITDLRTISGATNALRIPGWPDPDENSALRYFGAIVKRSKKDKKGVLQWPADSKFCNAVNTIRVNDLFKVKIPGQDADLAFSCRYRRFFKPENFIGRYEAAFTTGADKLILNNDAVEKLPADNKDTINSVIKSFLNLKIRVLIPGKKPEKDPAGKMKKPVKEFAELPLYLAGNKIAGLYLKGSTKNKLQKLSKIWWVKAGSPLSIVTYTDRGLLILPGDAELVEEMPEHGIHLYTLEQAVTKNQSIRVWLIRLDKEKKSEASIFFLRQLKLNLFRIHAEKEALRHVLSTISQQDFDLKDENAREDLSTYLEKSTNTLLKKKRFGINQDKIRESAIRNEELVDPGTMKGNLEMLKVLKNKYILTNVKKLSPREKKLVRIFIGHSKDVDKERTECILQIGKVNKAFKNLFLEYVNWHDDVVHGNFPNFKRIQDAINIKLKSCQMAVFIFNSRLGQYTLEEFRYASDRKKKIFVFYKKTSSVASREKMTYKKMQQFFKSLSDSVLRVEYKTLDGFKHAVYTNLNLYLSEKHKRLPKSA
jgi:hypothetical protein